MSPSLPRTPTQGHTAGRVATSTPAEPVAPPRSFGPWDQHDGPTGQLVNHITVAGRLVDDPVRKEANGSVVTSFRLAAGRGGSKTGRLWIDVDTWGRLAGTCHQHLAKGRHVLVAGRLGQREWADSSTGEKRSRYVVVATEVDFLPT